MWGYGGDLTYDFAAASAAWDLGLAEVKSLVRNSVTCSTLRGKAQAEALAALMGQWDAWVAQELEALDRGQASKL